MQGILRYAYGTPVLRLRRGAELAAMVGNHVADIVERYGENNSEIPSSLTDYIKNRRGYDYSKHGQSDNPYLEFITDDIVDEFCVLGTAKEHISKLEKLKEVGVTQFNIYLDSGDEESLSDVGTIRTKRDRNVIISVTRLFVVV